MKKKTMIRIREYAQLTGLTTQAVRLRIKAHKLESEKIGGIDHVPAPILKASIK